MNESCARPEYTDRSGAARTRRSPPLRGGLRVETERCGADRLEVERPVDEDSHFSSVCAVKAYHTSNLLCAWEPNATNQLCMNLHSRRRHKCYEVHVLSEFKVYHSTPDYPDVPDVVSSDTLCKPEWHDTDSGHKPHWHLLQTRRNIRTLFPSRPPNRFRMLCRVVLLTEPHATCHPSLVIFDYYPRHCCFKMHVIQVKRQRELDSSFKSAFLVPQCQYRRRLLLIVP